MVTRALRSSSACSFVACRVGESFYMLPVEHVQEIVMPLDLTALPHPPPGVIGAVEHRDRFVPILDLGERLGFGSTTEARRKWVLLRHQDRSLGVVVGSVYEVLEVPKSSLSAAPEVGRVELRGAKFVVQYGGEMAFVLDWESVSHLADLGVAERRQELAP